MFGSERLAQTAVHYQHGSQGESEGDEVARTHGCPHAVDAVALGEYEQQWHKEDKLTRKRQENRQLRLTDRLEIILNHYLGTHQRVEHEEDTEAVAGDGYHTFVDGKKAADGVRDELGEDETYRSHARGEPYTAHEGGLDTQPVAGAEVIAKDRLHTLGDAEYYHHEEHRRAVNDAVSSHGEVAVGAGAVKQSLIDEYHHQTGTAVHSGNIE